MDHSTEAEFLHHAPCPSCGSKDNLAVYSDGHGYCFGCQHYEPGDNAPITKPGRKPVSRDLIPLAEQQLDPISARGLSQQTVEKWKYGIATHKGKKVQVANYFDDRGQLVAQKVRTKDKDFYVLGEMKDALPLYGMWLWRDQGKKVVITEGEIDALSVSQMQGNKWPVVSVPGGAAGARKAIGKALEWLEGFDEVIFMFDMDEPGRKAVDECIEMLTPGKAKVATLPLKDANEMLKAKRGDEIINAIWDAKVRRPDGIVDAGDLLDLVLQDDTKDSLPYPWEGLNAMTHGLRAGELVTFTAGSGIGKSLACREIAHHLLAQGETVGYVALEESIKRTLLGLMSIELNKPLHLTREGVTDDDIRNAHRALTTDHRLYLYDHFGSSDIDSLLSKLRYLAKGCGCRWLVVDHLSIVVSGLGDGDERRLIDNAMTHLRSLVEETGVGMILVSHLKRPEGKGHEEGHQTSLSQLRGSHAIAQLSDMVLGLERNQQGDDPDVTTVRVLKNRYSGETGEACQLKYNRETGRLAAYDDCPFDDEGGSNDF